MKSPWKTLSSKYIHKNPWFSIQENNVLTPEGKKGVYRVIELPEVVTIVAINSKNEILLIEEYRYPHKKWMWELPIGTVDDTDIAQLDAAKRELIEETALISGDWIYCGAIRGLKGLSNQIRHTYIAKNVNESDIKLQESEGIRAYRFISFNDFVKEVESGVFDDAESVSSIFVAAIKLGLINSKF